MANRYWVGGSGTWDATTTTNWSVSSGGGGGASAPTISDNVIFNSASNATAYAVTVGTNANALDITIAGPASGNVTITSGTTAVINCYGSWTNAATGVVFTTTSGAFINFLATTTGKTITTNNVTLSAMTTTYGGIGGAWTLGSAFTATSPLIFNAGTFNTANFTITSNGLQRTLTNTTVLNLGNSTITASGNTTPIIFSTSTGLTINAGTSTIICPGNSPTFAGGGFTYYNVSFTNTGAGTTTINGVNIFNNLTFTSRSATGVRSVVFSASQTVSGTLTLGVANTSIRRISVYGTASIATGVGTPITLTVATIATLADVDFRDIVAAGASGTWSGTRLGNGGGNSNITFAAGVNKYWNLASGGSWTATAWALTSGSTVDVNNFPLAQDTIIIENTGLTASNTITLDSNWWLPTIDASTRTTAFTLASGAQTPLFFGSFTIPSVTTITGTGIWYFGAINATQDITTNSVSLTFPINIIGSNSNVVRLVGNLTTTNSVTLQQGTLNLNNNELSSTTFSATGTGVRTLAFGAGKIVLTGTNATLFTTSTSTNLTVTGTNPLIRLTTNATTGTRGVNIGAAGEANAISVDVTQGSDQINLSTTSGAYKNVDFTGFTGTVSHQNSIIVFGNWNYGGTTIQGTGTGTVTFSATSGTKTIQSNNLPWPGNVTFNGVGGTWSLTDSLLLLTTANLTLTAGTLTTNGNTVTAGFFLSNNSNTRALNLGSSTVIVAGTGTFWDITTSTGMTLNAGTSSLLFTGNSAVITFAGGGLTYYNVTFGATFYNMAITGVNTFNNFTVTSPPSAGRRLVALGNNNQVINGTFSSVGSAANQRILYTGGNSGTTSQITAAAISIADTDFSSIIAAGPATPWNGTRIGNGGTGSSNITFATPRTVYWNKPAGGNWSDNAWALSSGGGVSVDNFPLGQDTVILDNTGVGAVSTIVMDYGWNIGSLNAGSLTNALTMNWNTFDSRVCGFNGNVTLSSAITLTATQGATSFDAGTITTAGVVFPVTVTFNTVSGTMILADNFTCTGAYVGLASGTLDLNGKTLSCLTFDSTFTDLQPRQIAFNGGQINVTGNNATVWACENVTNFSYTGTPTVNFTYSGSTGTRTINHGATAGATEANVVDLNVTGGTDTFTFVTNSKVRNLNYTGFSGLGTTINSGVIYGNLTVSATQTISSSSQTTTFGSTSGVKTITTNAVSIDRYFEFNGAGGIWQLQDDLTLGRSMTLTQGTLDLNNRTVSCWAFSSNNTNTRTLAFGTTGKLVLAGNSGTTFSGGTSTGASVTGTNPLVQFTYSGSVDQRNIVMWALPEQQSISVEFLNNATDAVVIQGAAAGYRNIDFTNFNGIYYHANYPRCYGNFTLGPNVQYTTTNTSNSLTFAATSGTKTITTSGKTIDFNIAFNGIGGTWALQDALTLGSIRSLYLAAGTVLLKSGTTNTVESVVTTGTTNTVENIVSATTQRRLAATTPGSRAILYDPYGNNNLSYLTIQDIQTTGPGEWTVYVNNNNTDGGNNLGIIFVNQTNNFFLMF